MVGKIVGLEKSFWCLFGPAINVAARLSHITGRDRLYESCIAVITMEVADRFQVVRNQIANGTQRSSDGKGNADDSGTESLTGLSPGFIINVLGLHNIKGQGELLLYSVAESITADATPCTLTPFESGASADETQDIPHYTRSFRQRARSGLIGTRAGSWGRRHEKSPRGSSQNMITTGSRRRLCKFGDSYTDMDHVAEEESIECTPQSSSHTLAPSTLPEGLTRERSAMVGESCAMSASCRSSEDDAGAPAVDADKAADGSPPTHTFLDIAKKWNDAKAGLHLQGAAGHDMLIQEGAGTSQFPSGSEDDSGAGQLVSHWTRTEGLVQGSNNIMVPPSTSGSSRGASEGGSRRSLSKRSCKSSRSSSKSGSKSSSNNSSMQNSGRRLTSSAVRLLALDTGKSTNLIEGDSEDGDRARPSTPMNEPQHASLNEPGAAGHLDANPGAQCSEWQAEASVDEASVDVKAQSLHKQYMLRMEGFRAKSKQAHHAYRQTEPQAQNPMVYPHGQHDRDTQGSMRLRSRRRRYLQGSDSEDPTYPISRRDYPFSYRAMRRLNKCARPGFMAESEYDSRSSDYESGDSRADAAHSRHGTDGQLSPRSLLLREAETLQMEAMARARNAFRNLGLKKINERSKYSNSRGKSVRGGDTNSRSREGSSKSREGSSKSREGSTEASLSGSRSGSFHNSRRFNGSSKNSNSQSSFNTVSESGAGTTSTSTSEGFAGSFRSLLNDSFKQNILYGNSFQLLELEQMLDEQFPVYRKEVLSGSSDEASHTSSYVQRAVFKNEQKFTHRRMCWIEKILSSQNSLNRTHRTEGTNDGSSNNTQSSTGRLLAGEVEWFNEDSLHHIDSKEITVGGPFWHRRRSAWHQNPLMTGTNNYLLVTFMA